MEQYICVEMATIQFHSPQIYMKHYSSNDVEYAVPRKLNVYYSEKNFSCTPLPSSTNVCGKINMSMSTNVSNKLNYQTLVNNNV